MLEKRLCLESTIVDDELLSGRQRQQADETVEAESELRRYGNLESLKSSYSQPQPQLTCESAGSMEQPVFSK